MNNSYFIKSNYFHVQDHAYIIKKNNNRLEIETNLEVLGNFRLPERTLKISHTFYNQRSENNYLRIDDNKSCINNNTSYNHQCYVFTNKSFINLQNDRFFSQEIAQPTNVEFTTQADVDVGGFLNKSVYKNTEFDFYTFVDNIKSHSIRNEFKYQNSYSLNSNRDGGLRHNINLFDELHIKKNEQHKYFYKNLGVDFFDYSNNQNQYIKNWFSLDLKGDWSLVATKQYIDFNFEDERHVYEINQKLNLLTTPSADKKIIQFLTTFLQNKQKGFWFENMHSKTGLFFTKKTQGNLIIEAKLFHQNKVDNIKFSNFFTFKKDLKTPIATIFQSQKKFSALNKFKMVDLT